MLCQLMGASQDASLYLSSFSIVLIALDRLIDIRFSQKDPISSKLVGLECKLNTSMSFVYHLYSLVPGLYSFNLLNDFVHFPGLSSLVFHQAKGCIWCGLLLLWGTHHNHVTTKRKRIKMLQSWSSKTIEQAYSWTSISLQFFIPSVIIFGVYVG